MSNFSGTILTNLGKQVIAQSLTGKQFEITKVVLGDGIWNENTNPEELTSLISPKLTLPIADKEENGDTKTASCSSNLLCTGNLNPTFRHLTSYCPPHPSASSASIHKASASSVHTLHPLADRWTKKPINRQEWTACVSSCNRPKYTKGVLLSSPPHCA